MSNINDIGFSDSDFVSVEDLKGVDKVLHDFGNEMQEKLQRSLQQGGKFGSQIDTGELYQSIQFTTEMFGTKQIFKLKLADYYDYVNKGIKGLKSGNKAPNSPYKFGGALKPPTANKLKGWAYRKSLNPFAVARSIRDKGTYGSGFYDKVVTKERLNQLSNDLAKASKEDIRILIDHTIKGVFGTIE